jgi:O-antigen/teichoic acid export membrane protein
MRSGTGVDDHPPRWAALPRRMLGGHVGDTAWALLDQGAALVASVLSFLLLGRTLGSAGYGAFVGIYALIAPFSALSLSGVYLAILEHVVREREDPVEVTRSCLSLTVASALVWVPALGAISLRYIEGLPPLAALLLIGTEFCLNGVFTSAVGVQQALVGFAAAARLRILGALTRVTLLAALAAGGRLTLTSLAIGQAFTVGVMVVAALHGVSRLLGTSAWPGRIRRRHVRSALLYGLGIGASGAQTDGDKFVLNAAHHQADAGRYGAAYRLMLIVLLPVNALAGATHLSFLHDAKGAHSQLRGAVKLSLVTLAYAVPAVLGLVLIAPWVPRLLTRDFSETALILQLLAPVVILRGVGVFAMNGLMGLGRNGLRTALLLVNALFSLVLYAALIPSHAWRGALVATLISEVTLCASGWVALLWCERTLAAGKAAAVNPEAV